MKLIMEAANEKLKKEKIKAASILCFFLYYYQLPFTTPLNITNMHKHTEMERKLRTI